MKRLIRKAIDLTDEQWDKAEEISDFLKNNKDKIKTTLSQKFTLEDYIIASNNNQKLDDTFEKTKSDPLWKEINKDYQEFINICLKYLLPEDLDDLYNLYSKYGELNTIDADSIVQTHIDNFINDFIQDNGCQDILEELKEVAKKAEAQEDKIGILVETLDNNADLNDTLYERYYKSISNVINKNIPAGLRRKRDQIIQQSEDYLSDYFDDVFGNFSYEDMQKVFKNADLSHLDADVSKEEIKPILFKTFDPIIKEWLNKIKAGNPRPVA